MSDSGGAFVRPVTVFLVGLALRLALIAINPIIFGGDTILRLNDRFTLVKAHQLPMLQSLIAAVSVISMDPALVRVLMALIGGAACVGFYLLAKDLVSSPDCTDWLVTWGDKPPAREWGRTPAARVSVGNVAASTFHRECGQREVN